MNELHINKLKSDTRVIVAMSGGVDSSVVAAMMVEQGYETIGITLQLYDHGAAVKRKNSCCAGQDINDARAVCDKLGIPHYVLNYESLFRQEVIDKFADSYIRGQTPNPCVMCNQTVKFRDLLKVAKDLKADVMATGHYVRYVKGENSVVAEMHRGLDENKDQSYFLFRTTQEQLNFLRFPLGNKSKAETRRLAEKYGLGVSNKSESQDICFVPQGNYASVVKKIHPNAMQKGKIVHIDGRTLGQHEGIIKYTVGQRKGLGIGGGEPLYVVAINPEKNEVIVGGESSLYVDSIMLEEVNWLGEDIPDEGIVADIKIRSTAKTVPARVVKNGESGLKILPDSPEKSVSPGQACVIYDGDRVLGGGWII